MPIKSQKENKPGRPYLRRGHPSTKGLVAAYPVFAGAGTMFKDISGFNKDGTLVNTSETIWERAGSPIGMALNPDFTDDHIDIPFPFSSSYDMFNDGRTIITTFLMSGTANSFRTCVSLYESGGAEFEYLGVTASENHKLATNAHTSPEGTVLNVDTWYASAYVWDPEVGEYRIYLDGDLDYSATPTDTPSTWMRAIDSARIFHEPNSDDRWQGKMALVLIYNRTLPDSLIKKLAENPTLPFISR